VFDGLVLRLQQHLLVGRYEKGDRGCGRVNKSVDSDKVQVFKFNARLCSSMVWDCLVRQVDQILRDI